MFHFGAYSYLQFTYAYILRISLSAQACDINHVLCVLWLLGSGLYYPDV